MNKKFVVFDTETTSKFAKTAVMLSLSAVTCELNEDGRSLFMGPTDGFYDFYFKPVSEVPADARRVNHLTKSLLTEMSSNRTLSQQYTDVMSVFPSGVGIIGHNVKKYDMVVMEQNMLRNGFPSPVWGTVVDTYQLARTYLKKGVQVKDHKLTTIFEWCLKASGMTEESFKKGYHMQRQFREKKGLVVGKTIGDLAHTASYDTYMTFFVAKVLISKFGL